MSSTSSPHQDWVDLTHPLRSGMPVYPGDPCVRIAPALTLDDDGVAVQALTLGSHSGSHVDAPAHLVSGGRTADHLRRDELCGPALVLRLAGLQPREAISAERLAALLPQHEVPVRVLLHTGWDRSFVPDDDAADVDDAEARRRAHPVLSAEAAELLWQRGVRLLGVDTLSPDPTPAPDGPAPDAFPAHEVFLGGDGIIVENVAGLPALFDQSVADQSLVDPPQFDPTQHEATRQAESDAAVVVELHIAPLLIADGDGAPARIWARPLDPSPAAVNG
ncbi:MAG: cyclase family protein [Micrococcus sp.]|nr:cyclase family protein [Micrococcus sp.]